jgi:hypothetical protein
MDMNLHLHRVLGLYRTRAAADAVVAQLARYGIPQDKVDLHEPGHPTATSAAAAGSDDVLENVLKDGAVGTVAGSIAGAIGSAAMATANVSLLVASPLLAPLVMVGWGAGIGGLVGAAIGAEGEADDVPDQVRAGLDSGHTVLVAHTDGDAQTARAHQVIGESMGQSFPLPGSTS